MGQSRVAGAQSAEDRTDLNSEGEKAKAQNCGTIEEGKALAVGQGRIHCSDVDFQEEKPGSLGENRGKLTKH